MRDYKTIPKLFLLFFTALLMVLTFNTTTVKAINQTDIENAEKVMRKYDGIDNWQLQSSKPSNKIGKIPIGGNVSLGYTFGVHVIKMGMSQQETTLLHWLVPLHLQMEYPQ